MSDIETFADHAALDCAAAEALAVALANPSARSLVVTGGTTPGPTYDLLAKKDIDWSRITVTLTDDRWVESGSPDSNERLVRGRLLVGPAATARFLPLKDRHPSPDEGAAAVEERLRALAPFAATLLGMGEDGHVASLFPGAPGLEAALNPHGARFCVGVPMAGEKPFVPRISLTLRALLESVLVIVLITGAAKRKVIERVAAEPGYAPPIAAVLRQERTPVRILWAS